MKEELKEIADLYYLKIMNPAAKVNIAWVKRKMDEIGMKDKSINKLYDINAPLSREVFYYIFLKFYEAKKIDILLNSLWEDAGSIPIERIGDKLKSLGIVYDGKFKRKIFNIVVLVSGRGTNLQAIIDAIKEGKINGRIAAVISNRRKAYALERAKKHGIEAIYLPARKGEERESYDRKLAGIIDKKNPDLIVLAGFLRILSPWFVKNYKWKIINIHPALLPSFAGLYGEDVHRAVLEYGCKVSGCTVHFVDEKVDHGPIIVQKCVEVKDDDSIETLAARVLEKEHESLVEAIKLLSEGKIKIEGRRVLRVQ